MKKLTKVQELAKKMENNDTLITFGEEALTFRKDDPRTKEYKEKVEKEQKENREKLIEDDEVSLFHGINLSNEREVDESREDYKYRLKTNKDLDKIYKNLGREEAKKQFPEGFKQAIIYALEQQKKDKESPVEINNDKK